MEITIRTVLAISLAVFGSSINILAIIAVIRGGLYKLKAFTFVLNLFVSNLLMSSLSFPLSVPAQLSLCKGSDKLCPFSGFVIFSVSGISLWSVSMISLNRYVLIVHPTKFETIYSFRNTFVLLVVTWLYSPLLCFFPLTGLWGRFIFDETSCLCNPFITDNGIKYYALASTAVVTVLPISFCYIAILIKVISINNRVHARSNENLERRKQQRNFVRSILVMVSVFIFMNTPFMVTTLIDPKEDHLGMLVRNVSMYITTFSYSVNTLTYSVMNKQIRTSFFNIFKRDMKTKNPNADVEPEV